MSDHSTPVIQLLTNFLQANTTKLEPILLEDVKNTLRTHICKPIKQLLTPKEYTALHLELRNPTDHIDLKNINEDEYNDVNFDTAMDLITSTICSLDPLYLAHYKLCYESTNAVLFDLFVLQWDRIYSELYGSEAILPLDFSPLTDTDLANIKKIMVEEVYVH
jgi:hypothetical protein